MRKIVLTVFLFAFFLSLSAQAQWGFVKHFPNDTFRGATGLHGLTFDRLNRLWVQPYGATDSIYTGRFDKKPSGWEKCVCVYVFNMDGTQAPFSPIKTYTVNGVTDTMNFAYSGTNGRGLGINADGNILATHGGRTYVVDYKTGEALGKVIPVTIGTSGTNSDADDENNIYTSCVVGGNPVKVFDAGFNYTTTAVESLPGYGRALAVSGDGNTIYAARYTTPQQVSFYQRPDIYSSYVLQDSLDGYCCESIVRNRTTGLIWFDGGSFFDKAAAGTVWSPNTWYAYNPDSKTIVDSLKWTFETPGDPDARPRAITFSSTGDTCFVACFAADSYSPIQMLVKGASGPVPVTFSANMSVAEINGAFKPASDKLVVRGSFQTDAGDTGDWQGTNFTLTDPDNDKIYTTTVNMPGAKAGTKYEYKYVVVNTSDTWEAVDPNRNFILAGSAMTLPTEYWSNITTAGKNYTITFVADMSDLLVATPEPFNPTTDTLLVDGLTWFGVSTVVGDRVMKAADPFNPSLYSTTLTVTATDDSTKWKFHGYPTSKFGNSGYELGGDRWITFKNLSGTTVTLDPIKPNVALLGKVMTDPQPVLFQVNMNGAKNVLNGSDIEKSKIWFVGLKGASAEIGSWGGGWIAADTAGVAPTMLVLHDDGTFGDKVAGDNTWSRIVTFAAGTREGNVEFKFGAWYDGAAAATTASTILDNEGGFGSNHVQMIRQASGTTELSYAFGNFTGQVGVKESKLAGVPTDYNLGQNYPNPFNPSTKISYSVPQNSFVTLKVYNMLGQQVAQLVNSQKTAGNYELAFDASKLTSGIYMYSIQAGKFNATKKMMLIK